ncbi:MAG: prolyl oligopeptidase family serine peptidase [Zavarzinella sp.]
MIWISTVTSTHRRYTWILVVGMMFTFTTHPPAIFAQETSTKRWKVGGVDREGLVYVPTKAKTAPTPIVFVFHGHGGSSRNAFNSFAMHKAWPEAISVYLQGLNTPGQLTDPEGKKTGWQSKAGDQNDRDLKFFDTVLDSLKAEFKVDEKRIYSTGHSNGGGFTYLLWAERGDRFAAMAPSAAVGMRSLPNLKPKPMFHIASENDPLVKYAWQKRMIESIQKLNATTGSKLSETSKNCTLYPSKDGNDVVVFMHDGGHKFAGKDAVAAMVQFFQQHPKK